VIARKPTCRECLLDVLEIGVCKNRIAAGLARGSAVEQSLLGLDRSMGAGAETPGCSRFSRGNEIFRQ